MRDEIGEYYERCRLEHKRAWQVWQEACAKYQAEPTYENEKAKHDAYEAMIDAGNTGD